MRNYRTINTKGDPLGSVRDFVHIVWLNAGLSGMLVPINGSVVGKIVPQVIRDPIRLRDVNPFKPLMSLNTAKLIPDLIDDHSKSRMGVLLRPCELRALIEMAKRDGIVLDNILTINIDCLGTYPANEFLWRAERKGSAQKLTDEALRFAPQGGIMAYRYRSACQLCVSPDAQGADINIGILGLPVRKHILISTRNDDIAEQLKLDQITDEIADPSLVAQREKLLARLVERRGRTKDRVIKGISDTIPGNVFSLIKQLENCGDCQKCMEACPICTVEFPKRDENNQYKALDIKRWLVSCSGCGICEQDCPQSQPLNAIFSNIHEQLTKELNYIPGASVEDPLPAIL